MQASGSNNSNLIELSGSGWEQKDTGVVRSQVTGCAVGDPVLIGAVSRAGRTGFVVQRWERQSMNVAASG